MSGEEILIASDIEILRFSAATIDVDDMSVRAINGISANKIGVGSAI